MNVIILFIILSILNVIFSTIKSIVTIRGNKWIASLINASYYAFYNVVIIYTVMDFSLLQKCIVTFICNLIGVFIVKHFEEKHKKETLWKIELTVKNKYIHDIHHQLDDLNIIHRYFEDLGKYAIVNIYCRTKEESKQAIQIGHNYNAKFFIAESKEV